MYYILTTILHTPLGTGDKEGTSQAEEANNTVHVIIRWWWCYGEKLCRVRGKGVIGRTGRLPISIKLLIRASLIRWHLCLRSKGAEALGISQWRTFQSEQTASARTEAASWLGFVLATNYKFHFIHSTVNITNTLRAKQQFQANEVKTE